METNTRTKKFIKFIFIVSLLQGILMLLATAWTLYGPIPGTRFEAVVELSDKGAVKLRHNRYFISPVFLNANLSISVQNLPDPLSEPGTRVQCAYHVLERNIHGATLLDGRDCTIISIDASIDLVRALPVVQEFARQIETSSSGRRISYRIETLSVDDQVVVVVAETDDTKETVWKRFLVNKKSAQILVENSLTGEVESYK